ncbi:hypothetical protein [Flavobacterium sp.]|nr:hypothetical protein [Flavobacterium sp.]|tara:strand:+ start:3129 stop:3272 length:144 start_codon:yes stop_codon:yes gene_type:complete
MKFLKSPWLITILVVIAGAVFSAEIMDTVAKVSPDLANKLRRTPKTN